MATDGDWIIPPPSSGTAAFAFRKADDLDLSADVIDALETLSRAFSDDDVTGFMRNDIMWCPTKGCGTNACVSYQSCFKGACQPNSCRIG